jgi:hypothetical protein
MVQATTLGMDRSTALRTGSARCHDEEGMACSIHVVASLGGEAALAWLEGENTTVLEGTTR